MSSLKLGDLYVVLGRVVLISFAVVLAHARGQRGYRRRSRHNRDPEVSGEHHRER